MESPTLLSFSTTLQEEMPRVKVKCTGPHLQDKDNIMECGSLWGIKLMSHTMKTWERIVDNRIRSKVVISQEQFGFIKGRTTEDAIYALRQLLEKYKKGHRKLHCIFIDLEKAYNRVPREELVWCMRKKKVSEKYIRLVLDMYKNAEIVVRSTAGTSEPFQ